MQPRIETLKEKKLIGKNLKVSLTNNKTVELWRSFMPRRKEITNNLTTELFSLQVYEPSYFDNFNPSTEFEKWALIEVPDFEKIPEGMQAFTLVSGLYAVFYYKGLNTDTKIFEYIFGTWLPSSVYVLDQRPHFEIMGEKYKNADPNSEEEIWIPIKPK
ncbi:MAG: GyrI-like domain-containing protein [Bacteroidetes bacterium]|nr:GyrI-like domain-containing protein [Bacteroidota bacterium]